MVAVQIEIDAESPATVAARLGVSVRCLTQWRSDLRKVLSKKEFDWFNHEPSISQQSIRALEKYQVLIEKLGKEKAKNYLRINGV